MRLLGPRGFSRQEYWNGLSSPPPGGLPNPGIKPRSPTLQVDSLSSEPSGEPTRWLAVPELRSMGMGKRSRAKPSDSLQMFCLLVLRWKRHIHCCEHSRWSCEHLTDLGHNHLGSRWHGWSIEQVYQQKVSHGARCASWQLAPIK